MYAKGYIKIEKHGVDKYRDKLRSYNNIFVSFHVNNQYYVGRIEDDLDTRLFIHDDYTYGITLVFAEKISDDWDYLCDLNGYINVYNRDVCANMSVYGDVSRNGIGDSL